ncbi:MAG TPA: imidazole glycerol phosphate synthase subunit HisH [Cyclobacteriaceae bacterium]|jgi:glutamine amidotransferase|nr:imidazole glycerol phosphate synthase subunit HisH [Cyclobacteriaceae bacterium]
MIAIVNYGSGNIQAIGNIFKRSNIDFFVAEAPEQLEQATKLILPGVGAFDKTMQQLIDSGLKEKLDDLVLHRKVPVLGICVGMQILGKDSEEGQLNGLGWIDGHVKKIDVSKFTHKPHVPHMGWNSVKPLHQHPLMEGIDLNQGFYFLHTYFFSCNKKENILCTTEYGNEFASGVYSNNVYGMQFHPEKSHSNGIQLLENFAKL